MRKLLCSNVIFHMARHVSRLAAAYAKKELCIYEPERPWIMLSCHCALGAMLQACSPDDDCTIKYQRANEPLGLPQEQRGPLKVK